jgi:hypothetical protein
VVVNLGVPRVSPASLTVTVVSHVPAMEKAYRFSPVEVKSEPS